MISAGVGSPFDQVNRTVAHVRVIDAVGHFAQNLPYRIRCSDDLDHGLEWAMRGVALLHHEIAPDPPGWRTALRFDMDCPCDRRPHARAGYCPRAATFWSDANLAEPNFVVTNPANGHAHYVYLLAGWIRTDGQNEADVAAVRYLTAIERAYTIALHADPGYAGLVHHNPFSPRYETTNGRDKPYSLHELATFVTLGSPPRRRTTEIRTDGRNIETFDRLRYWAYSQIGEWRCGSYDDWSDVVAEHALQIAADVRDAHGPCSHPFSDAEVLDIAKSVTRWVWLRYDGANPTISKARMEARRSRDRQWALETRRAQGAVPRDSYLAEAQERRTTACSLRAMGLAVDEIARRLGAGVRSVYRWIAELRSVPSASCPSDFVPLRGGNRIPEKPEVAPFSNQGFVELPSSGSHGASIEDRCEYGPTAHSAEQAESFALISQVSSSAEELKDAPKKAGSSWARYIEERVAQVIARSRERNGGGEDRTSSTSEAERGENPHNAGERTPRR
jgi:hypothetical protein